MPFVSLFLILLVAVGLLALRAGRRILAIVSLAPALGLGSYAALGLFIARFRSIGRFYSVPFGGERVTDPAILGSMLAWLVFWALALGLMTRRRAGAAYRARGHS